MNNEQVTDLIIKLTAELSALNANMKTVLDKLSNHEVRLVSLEQGKTGMKDNIVKWLVIALIGTVSIIATLTGSSALIKTLLGL